MSIPRSMTLDEYKKYIWVELKGYKTKEKMILVFNMIYNEVVISFWKANYFLGSKTLVFLSFLPSLIYLSL